MTFNLKKRRKRKIEKKNNETLAEKVVKDSFSEMDHLNSIYTVESSINDSKFEVKTEVNGETFLTSCPAYIDVKKNKLLIVEDECETVKLPTLNTNNEKDQYMGDNDNIVENTTEESEE